MNWIENCRDDYFCLLKKIECINEQKKDFWYGWSDTRGKKITFLFTEREYVKEQRFYKKIDIQLFKNFKCLHFLYFINVSVKHVFCEIMNDGKNDPYETKQGRASFIGVKIIGYL